MIRIRLNKSVYRQLVEELPEAEKTFGSKIESEEGELETISLPGNEEDLKAILDQLSYLDADD